MQNPQITPFQTNVRPGWMGDFASREHILAGGAKVAANTFPGEEAVLVKLSANAAADATSLTVVALGAPLPSGTILAFGGKKYATLTAAAIKGATTLTVSALATALVSGDQSYYLPPNFAKRIASGRIVGCTYAELEAGANTGMDWGKAVDSDDIVNLIAYDVPDADKDNDINLYRVGGLVLVNFLPGWADLSATLKGKIHARYECSVGAPGAEVPTT